MSVKRTSHLLLTWPIFSKSLMVSIGVNITLNIRMNQTRIINCSRRFSCQLFETTDFKSPALWPTPTSTPSVMQTIVYKKKVRDVNERHCVCELIIDIDNQLYLQVFLLLCDFSQTSLSLSWHQSVRIGNISVKNLGYPWNREEMHWHCSTSDCSIGLAGNF